MNQVEAFHIVPVGPDGCPAPDLANPPVEVHIGDIYLTETPDHTAYTEWIRYDSDWVQVGETTADPSGVDMLKKQRVNAVRDYFREKEEEYKKRKRLQRVEDIKKYFNDRKYFDMILNQPSFDYTQLYTDLIEEKL
jgi:hypothetical protein